MSGSSIDEVLAESRRNLERVQPEQLEAELSAGALLVDIRPVENRDAEGLLPSAVVVDRNVLEWRLDPTSPDRIPESDDPHRRVILVCNEGYASSLAAETLQRVGLPRATDLAGGYRAWREWRSAGAAAGAADGEAAGRRSDRSPTAAEQAASRPVGRSAQTRGRVAPPR